MPAGSPMPDPSAPRTIGRSLSRRQFLARAGLLGAGALAGGSLLAACGGGDDEATSDAADTTTAGAASETTAAAAGTAGTAGATETSASAATKLGGKLTFLNWPLYIENDQDPGSSPTLKGFTAKTGVKVDYTAGIDGNDSFYTKYEPDLAKGHGIGIDLVVLTSWMAARMIEKGFVQPLDAAAIPNKANLLPQYANPTWDPGNTYSLPWASVIAGIGYYPEKCGFEITSVNDLFDPRLKNRVTILDELRDTVGLVLLGMGVDPAKATLEEMLAACDKVGKAREAGQFRRITGNSYAEDLGLGDVWAAIAWAGDIASLQKDHPDLQWVYPKEGATLATDNLLIPIGAPNKAAADAFVNYVYDPAVAGPLHEAINFPGAVSGEVQHMGAGAQKSVFLNPPAGTNLVEFRILTADEDEKLSEAFAKATQQ